ncbi:protein PXR1-like [Centruroides sculpturatus]|uniref:protein PXR1-like n=1 Tax=Centruroides sculpturatus TaxID=218467 RepID=UPI000C6D61D2|nr:protein PXR1-like [Centruroides sculpturatus]
MNKPKRKRSSRISLKKQLSRQSVIKAEKINTTLALLPFLYVETEEEKLYFETEIEDENTSRKAIYSIEKQSTSGYDSPENIVTIDEHQSDEDTQKKSDGKRERIKRGKRKRKTTDDVESYERKKERGKKKIRQKIDKYSKAIDDMDNVKYDEEKREKYDEDEKDKLRYFKEERERCGEDETDENDDIKNKISVSSVEKNIYKDKSQVDSGVSDNLRVDRSSVESETTEIYVKEKLRKKMKRKLDEDLQVSIHKQAREIKDDKTSQRTEYLSAGKSSKIPRRKSSKYSYRGSRISTASTRYNKDTYENINTAIALIPYFCSEESSELREENTESKNDE